MGFEKLRAFVLVCHRKTGNYICCGAEKTNKNGTKKKEN